MTRTRIKYCIALALLAVASSPVRADEAAVRRMMEDKVRGGGRVESVQRTPSAGLYEVVVRTSGGAMIYYVDSAATVIIEGRMIDARSGADLTEARERRLNAVKWDTLPLQWAITTTRGNGRRKIAVLSDPNCPYCKRLEGDLAKLDDITVNVLPYPVLGPESERLAKAVWCSANRAKAWDDLMFRRVMPAGRADCETPVEKLQAYGRSIGANATPTWFVETGERFSGALPLEEVRRLLDAASPAKR